MSATAEGVLRKLVREYQDHNSSTVAELEAVPTPLAFSRFVAANRPVVIRGAGKETQVPALERWTDEYLVDKLAERELEVSVTPEGRVCQCVFACCWS